MNTYRVSDFVIRIKNAAAAKRKEVAFPYSRLNYQIAAVLVKEGFLEEIRKDAKGKQKQLVAKVKYEKKYPVFTDVEIVSKPSLRVFIGAKNIQAIQRKGQVIIVLSTNQGVITGRDALKKGVGGELLFKIW